MSRVNRNADRSSYVLQKVASVDGGQEQEQAAKEAKKKRAFIDKRIPGMATMVSAVKKDESIPLKKLREIKKAASFDNVLGASACSGFVLKPSEFQYLFLEEISPGLGEKFARESTCFPSSTDIYPTTIGSGEGCEELFSEFLEDRWLSDDALAGRLVKMSSVVSDEPAYRNDGTLPAVSALYNGYVCGIMGRVLNRGVSSDFVKSAAIKPKAPLRIATPLNLGAGALAYMIANMLQSVRDPQEQRGAVSSLLSDPRVAGILTMTGTAALRRKLGI
jgi:hypothetical protein